MSILNSEISLFEFATHPKIFGNLYPPPLDDCWFAWNTIFKAYSAMNLDKKEQRLFGEITGGLSYHPGKVAKNFCGIIGRGGGKTFNVGGRWDQYRALTFNYPLAPGQTARNIILSPSFRTGGVGLDFIEGLFNNHPSLDRYVIGRKKTEQIAELRLANNFRIQVMPVVRVSGRGPSTWTLYMDEAAHFRIESLFSAEEIFKSARGSMNRFGMDSIFQITTTPLTKQDMVFDLHDRYFGVQNDFVLVVQGSGRLFNPRIPEEFIRQDLEHFGEDYVKREHDAQFVDAQAAAFSSVAIVACKLSEAKLPYNSDFQYYGLLDSSGLTEDSKEGDEFTAGVFHVEEIDGKEYKIVDAVSGWSARRNSQNKATPAKAINGSIELFKEYRVEEIHGDHYGGKWLQMNYENAGFTFEVCKLSASDLYLELEPSLNNHSIKYVDPGGKVSQQLKALERKHGQGTKDKIFHGVGRHDDYATIIGLANHIGDQKMGSGVIGFGWV